jgi:pimeloyl-ACP methyl ester carboxylesterase
MQLLDTRHGPVAYDERGTGPSVVLLAAGAHDHHDFDALRALLPPDVRSIAVDWPSHGRSPAATGTVSCVTLAETAEDVVRGLAPEGAVVVGNSVGGFAAARMAIRCPQLVQGLVLVDAGGFLGAPLHVRITCWLMGRPRFLREVYPAFSLLYTQPRTAAADAARRNAIATTRADPGLRAVSELWRSFVWPEHDLRAEASAIGVPTLILWGRRDPVIPVAVAHRLVRTLPDARVVEFRTGHLPHVTDPAGVASELTPFVRAVFGSEPA